MKWNTLIGVLALVSFSQATPLIEPRVTFDEAQKLLDDLIVLVTNLSDTNTVRLGRLRRELTDRGNSIIVPARAEIRVLEAHLMTEVQTVKDRFLEQGLDLTDCIGRYTPELNALPRIVLRQIEDCVGGITEVGSDVITAAIAEMDGNRLRLDRFALQLDECRVLLDQTDCVNRVAENLLLETDNLPSIIQEDVSRTTAVIRALENGYSACSLDRIDEIEFVGNALIGYIITCAGG